MLPISICMIAKNEEKNIDSCLLPLSKHGFELIVADTGSTDQTLQLLKKYTEHTYQFDWQDDFSAARNFSIAHASNDWILVVDFDEYLEQIDVNKLSTFISKYPKGIGTITRHNTCKLLTGQASEMTEQVARFFNRKYHHYEGVIHEQVMPIDGSEPQYFEIPISFYHEGYAEPALLQKKADRDLNLLCKALKQTPNDPYLLYQIGKCYQVKKDYSNACAYFDQGLSSELNPSLSYVQDMVEAYGYSLLENKDYETALGLSGIYDLFSSSADFLFLMGLIYMNNALFEQAIAEFENAAGCKHAKVAGINSYLSYYNIGVICECIKQREKAIYFYKKCGNYEPALTRLAII